MLQYTMDLIAYVASDTHLVFMVCNLIILLLIVVSSISSWEICSEVHQHYPAYHPLVERNANNIVRENTTSGGTGHQMTISLTEEQFPTSRSPLTTDEDKLRLVEVPRVLSQSTDDYNRLKIVEVPSVMIRPTTDDNMRMVEGLRANAQCAYENKQSLMKAPIAEIQSEETGELLRLNDCTQNNNCDDQIISYAEEEGEEEFRQQVEELIRKVTEGWKAEKMMTSRDSVRLLPQTVF